MSEHDTDTLPEPRVSPFAALAAQCWRFCGAYLLIGLALEVARRLGAAWAARALAGLDGLPLFVLSRLGLLHVYLSAVYLEDLSPFLNRVVLSSVGLVAIAAQVMVVGAAVALALRAASMARRS